MIESIFKDRNKLSPRYMVCKELEAKPIENAEEYIQDLCDRGMVDIKSLTSIGISGIPTEDLDRFLDNIIERRQERTKMSPNPERREREEIESGLGSQGKIRILGALAKNPDTPLTRYSLEKLTNLKPTDVKANLKVLVRMKWVTEHPYQPRKYGINLENETVRHLIEFFRRVRYV